MLLCLCSGLNCIDLELKISLRDRETIIAATKTIGVQLLYLSSLSSLVMNMLDVEILNIALLVVTQWAMWLSVAELQ